MIPPEDLYRLVGKLVPSGLGPEYPTVAEVGAAIDSLAATHNLSTQHVATLWRVASGERVRKDDVDRKALIARVLDELRRGDT